MNLLWSALLPLQLTYLVLQPKDSKIAMKFQDSEPTMHTRRGDDPIASVIRVVDWKWMAAVVGAGIIWAANQWVQYNALLVKFSDQTELFVKMSSKVDGLSIQLSAIQTDKMKQDFELSRLKDKQDQFEAWRNSMMAVQPRGSK
jgi:hypothetical protein